jgi:hypothetical protein
MTMTTTAAAVGGRASYFNGARGGESIVKLVQARAIEELPTYQRILEQHHEQLAAIDAEPFIESEKQKRRAAVLDRTRDALTAELETLISTRTREFVQQEGEARAGARREELMNVDDRQFRRDQALASEWQLLIAGVPQESSIAALEALAADAALTENPRIYRAALAAITQQSARLAAIERRKNQAGPLGAAQIGHARLSGEFDRWRKTNPTPAERVRQAQDGRKRRQQEIERSARSYRQLYGLER